MERQYSWSDNKDLRLRKAMNYERNLRRVDTMSIPWKYYTLGQRSFSMPVVNDNESHESDKS